MHSLSAKETNKEYAAAVVEGRSLFEAKNAIASGGTECAEDKQTSALATNGRLDRLETSYRIAWRVMSERLLPPVQIGA